MTASSPASLPELQPAHTLQHDVGACASRRGDIPSVDASAPTDGHLQPPCCHCSRTLLPLPCLLPLACKPAAQPRDEDSLSKLAAPGLTVVPGKVTHIQAQRPQRFSEQRAAPRPRVEMPQTSGAPNAQRLAARTSLLPCATRRDTSWRVKRRPPTWEPLPTCSRGRTSAPNSIMSNSTLPQQLPSVARKLCHYNL